MIEWTHPEDGPKAPRFRPHGKMVRLTWNEAGCVTVRVGQLLFESALERFSPRGFAPLWLVPRADGEPRVFRSPVAAFNYWLGLLEPVLCENDDCLALPDGRVMDLQ